ncbi:MAG: phage major capsid protein [Nitrospira sp.]|nr:phage major capsid protein [Nitrospira sp.]
MQNRNEPLPENLQAIVDTLASATELRMYQWLDRQEELRRPKNPRLSLARTITGLAHGKLDGEDREVLEETARRNNLVFDPLKPFIEFRDLSTTVPWTGGFLKQTDTREALDILRPWSVTARAGLLVETGLIGDVAIPKVTVKSTPSWLNTESAQVSPSTPTLSQVAMVPKTVGAVIAFSRQLARQAHADRVVGRELLRTLGTAIDQAVLSGSGANGQPLGLLNTSGIQTQTGTTLNTGVLTMKRKSAEANVNDEAIAFLSTPAVRELLESREKATGGGKFVWEKDLVADRPAMVSTDVPTATMLCGDWSLVYLGIWGQGFVLEIIPFDPVGFKAGIIHGRMLVTCDVALLHPSAFVTAQSIT